MLVSSLVSSLFLRRLELSNLLSFPLAISLQLMVGFYAILWLTGSTIEDATRAGWVNESVESPSW